MDTNINKLIVDNMKLATVCVTKSKLPFEFEELQSVAYEALVKAAHSFDANKGTQFSTYAMTCMHNALCMFARNNSKYLQIYHYDATIDDTCGNYLDLIPDTTCDIETIVECNMLAKYIKLVLSPRDADILFMKFGINQLTPMRQTDIAKKFNVTQSVVSRSISRSLKKLKEYINSR